MRNVDRDRFPGPDAGPRRISLDPGAAVLGLGIDADVGRHPVARALVLVLAADSLGVGGCRVAGQCRRSRPGGGQAPGRGGLQDLAARPVPVRWSQFGCSLLVNPGKARSQRLQFTGRAVREQEAGESARLDMQLPPFTCSTDVPNPVHRRSVLHFRSNVHSDLAPATVGDGRCVVRSFCDRLQAQTVTNPR